MEGDRWSLVVKKAGRERVSLSPLLPCGLGGGLLTKPSLWILAPGRVSLMLRTGLLCGFFCLTEDQAGLKLSAILLPQPPRADKGKAVELSSHLLLALCHASHPGLLLIYLQGLEPREGGPFLFSH